MDTVMFFSTKTCPTCKLVWPTVRMLRPDTVYVELQDDDPRIPLYDLSSVPTIIILDDGVERKRITGGQSKKKLEEFLTK